MMMISKMVFPELWQITEVSLIGSVERIIEKKFYKFNIELLRFEPCPANYNVAQMDVNGYLLLWEKVLQILRRSSHRHRR